MQAPDGWLLTAERTAIHVPTGTAVVSDLHLGYGEVRRRGGDAVPILDIVSLLEPLRQAFHIHAVRRMVIAGDLFEAGLAVEIIRPLLGWLRAASVELAAVVPGNHDRGLARAAGLLPVHPDGFTLGRWRVVHGDSALPDGPVVQGHEHPRFRWSAGVSAPCYLIGPARVVLPAYSPDAAGVNILGRRAWRDFRCAVIVGKEVLDFGPVAELFGKTRGRFRSAARRPPPSGT
jgi:uncharacterized protein